MPPSETKPRLTKPQQALLAEIGKAREGVLYVTRWGRYHRTVEALVRKGYAVMAEPDYSGNNMDGYSLAGEVRS